MQVHRLHRQADHQRWRAPRIGTQRQIGRVGGQDSAAIHAQSLVKARHHEQSAQAACDDDVLQRVQPVVARRIGHQQRLRVQHLHKTRLTPARRRVHVPIRIAAGQHHKGRQTNEPHRMRVERRDFFFERTLTGGAVELAQGGEGGDVWGGHGRAAVR